MNGDALDLRVKDDTGDATRFHLIVLVITGIFLLAWVFAPRRGLVSRWAGHRAAAVSARR